MATSQSIGWTDATRLYLSFEAELEHIHKLLSQIVEAETLEQAHVCQAKLPALDLVAQPAGAMATSRLPSKSTSVRVVPAPKKLGPPEDSQVRLQPT